MPDINSYDATVIEEFRAIGGRLPIVELKCAWPACGQTWRCPERSV